MSIHGNKRDPATRLEPLRLDTAIVKSDRPLAPGEPERVPEPAPEPTPEPDVQPQSAGQTGEEPLDAQGRAQPGAEDLQSRQEPPTLAESDHHTGENTDAEDIEDVFARDCHQMLLRLAGKAPDGLLALCRAWLADGRLVPLTQSLVFWALSADAALNTDDLNVLAALHMYLDGVPADLADIRVAAGPDRLFFAFFPSLPAEAGFDLAGEVGQRMFPAEAEAAAVQAMEEDDEAVGLWRSWRLPDDLSPWPPPKRVFVAETDPEADVVALTAWLQSWLVAAGEPEPHVQVYRTGEPLPPYTQAARDESELLWASTADPGVRIAPPFDGTDDSGPYFLPGHPVLDEAEHPRVAGYLGAGASLLQTGEVLPDLLDDSRGACVPLGFRTDGTWVWAESTAYYATAHRLAPDDELLAHIRSLDYQAAPVNGVGIYRAAQLIRTILAADENTAD